MRSSTQNLIAKLRELAASGVDRREAARLVGMQYGSVVNYGKKYGIDFPRKKRNTPLPITYKRNRDIADRYLAGEVQADLAREYGITRERVRQICDKLECVQATKRHADFMATVVGAVVRKNLTTAEAMEMFGISRLCVYLYCRAHGVKPSRLTAEEAAEIDALVDEASTKKSIWETSGRNSGLAHKIQRVMRKRGLKSKGRSRWDDCSHRKILLPEWRSFGLSWQECADKLAQHDGKPISQQALYMWACRHMPEMVSDCVASGKRIAA